LTAQSTQMAASSLRSRVATTPSRPSDPEPWFRTRDSYAEI
jgi:hypothetical protein